MSSVRRRFSEKSALNAPTIGGLNNDAGSAAKTLAGAGGAISYDSHNYQVFGIDHEIKLTSRHADGSARTKQAGWRDNLKAGLKKLFGGRRQPLPKADQLRRQSNNEWLLGRADGNIRNLSRLHKLRNSDQDRADPDARSSTDESVGDPPTVDDIRNDANGQLNDLVDRIDHHLDQRTNDLQTNRDDLARNRGILKGLWFGTLSKTGKRAGHAKKTAETNIASLNKEIDAVGNEALTRLSNLETTLRASSHGGVIANEHKDQIRQGREKALRSMIQTRLPEMTSENLRPRLDTINSFLVLNADVDDDNIDKDMKSLRDAHTRYVRLGSTGQEKLDALRTMDRALMKLDSKGAFEDAFSNSVYQLEGLKENLAQVRKSVALDLAVETLCKLEQENGQDPEYQKNRAIILNHITKFGSTRDWSASDDVNKQADAADSVLALVQGLEDGTNVDMLLGGDSRLDDARLNIKLNAAKRKIEANGIGHRQQAFTRQSDLIKAEHHLSIAKRRLTSRLEAADHQGIQKADPDQIGGFGARDDNQVHGRKLVTSAFGRNPRYVDQKANRSTKSIWWRKASPLGRLFGTHSMGGVKMDARLLNAVAHDKAGKKRVQQINLLMASVGRWQDEVDKAKDAIDQADGTTTPRTQAEKRLMDHAQQPRTFIQSELRRLNNRKNQLELKANNDDAELADTDDVDEDSGLSLEEQQELAECIRDIDKLNRESQSYQQRLANGPNIPLPHRHQNTQLGGFESQVAQERQQHQRIKDDLGQFSDYGIDKKTARDVFVKHNALATKDERGRPQNEQTSQQTRRQLNIDDRRPPSQFTVDQEQLVKQSIKNLTKTKMVSTDDAIAGSKAIKQIAGDVFNETSNIMAMQMEVSSDFSPEVQANEFQRAVLQTYTSDHSASVSANDDQTQTKMMARTQPLQMALTNDKRRYDQLAYQYHDHSIQMAAAKQSEQRLEQEYNQALEPIDKSIDDEQAKKERNRRDKIINDYHYKSNQEGLKLQHHQTQLNQVRTQLRQNHYYQKNELATAENRVTREMSDEHGIQQQTARQYERQVANTLNTRKTLFPHLDQRVANNAANGQAAAPPLEHRDMINILRAAVLSARKPGTRMDQYNPALHKADIEQTLTNWGILPELVRPELDDIMTTRLDKDEIERWQKDFKDIDTSRGAGDKLYSGSAGKQMAKPFYGAGPANFKDKHVKQRVDHQVRHLNAQIDEMTPGSKLRVSYQSSKDIDASVTAKKGVVAAEIEGDIEWGSDSEIEILCHDDSYDMQIKPGSHLAASISASASLQLGKFVNLGASLGIDLEHTHFNGIILKFDREDDPEAAKQKLQKFVEAMARGEDLSVDEWNGLTDNVQLVYEKQNQGGVEAGVKAEANLTDDLLGNTAAAKLSLGATGQMLGRTKTHVITDAESLTLEAEKKYSYQATADIDMDVRLAFGQSPNKSNLPDVNAHNQSSQNFQAGSDELGKGTIQSGPLKGTGANINVDLELGASTTWERRAYAKSKVTMNRSTGLIEKAELDFESTMNGNTMDTDEKRQKTAFKLLKRLGTWSGHGAEIDRMIGPEAVPNDLRRDLNEVFKHTSGSDFLNLKLALKEDKKDEANELLAQANELDDPSKGRVTEATKEEAAKLRKQAQKILDNRANFYPQKVNLIPTQDDEISRSGDYFPGVSELAGSKYGSGPVGVPLGFTDPAIQISKQMGGQLASWSPASGKLVMTATERSNLKHELGNEHNLGWQAPAKDQFFAGNGDTVIEPPSISSPSPSPPSSNIGADDNNEQIIDLNLNRNLSTDSHDDADDNDEILISSQNDASGPAKSPKSSNVNGASNVQQLLQQDKLFERDRAHFLAYAQPKKNIKLYTAEAQKQNSQYYQESQHGAQCGKHAINAYFGGPVITNMDQMTAFTAANRLLGYKNDHADKQVINTQLGNDHDNVPDYVNWAITKGNIRGASPIETSKINNVNEVDMPKNVDRCIVMTHGQETSHFVAFRRNTNGDWRLIDSLNAQKKQLNNKQPKMTPEQYIQQKLKTQQKNVPIVLYQPARGAKTANALLAKSMLQDQAGDLNAAQIQYARHLIENDAPNSVLNDIELFRFMYRRIIKAKYDKPAVRVQKQFDMNVSTAMQARENLADSILQEKAKELGTSNWTWQRRTEFLTEIRDRLFPAKQFDPNNFDAGTEYDKIAKALRQRLLEQ